MVSRLLYIHACEDLHCVEVGKDFNILTHVLNIFGSMNYRDYK